MTNLTQAPLTQLQRKLKERGDVAHLAGDFELAKMLLWAEHTIEDLNVEIRIAQLNAKRMTEERCISELLEAINTKKVDATPVKKERTDTLPEWLQEVFGGEA
jgi:hypothetical protein